MQKYQIELPLPSQGINYGDDSLIADNEAAEGTVNISFKDLIPHTRNGYIKQALYTHAGEDYAISRLAFHFVAGVKRMLFVYGATPLQLIQMNESKTPVRRALGAVGSSRPCFLPIACALAGGVAYSEKVIMVDGTAIKYFDETANLTAITAYSPSEAEITAYGTNVLTDTPDEINKQKYILNDDNRIWLSGYGQIVRVSHLGAAGAMPDYWPSTQVLKMSEDVTGMARFMGDVIIFTKNTATMITGSTPIFNIDGSYKNTLLPGGYGCAQHETICVGDNSLYWANDQGIYRYSYQPTGFSIPQCISEFMLTDGHTRTIKKRLEQITDWTKVFAVFHNHEYHLYLGGGEALIYDSITGSWTFHKYFNEFGCGAVYQSDLYYGGSTVSDALTSKYHVYQMEYKFDAEYGTTNDGLSDDGNAIIFRLLSKIYDMKKPANKKRFKKLYLTFYSMATYTVTLTLNIDNIISVLYENIINALDDDVSRWGNEDEADDATEVALKWDDVLNSGLYSINYPIKINHRGKRYSFQYELSCSALDNSWSLTGAVLLLKEKELK